MDETRKCAVLNEIYRIHEEYIADIQPACKSGCSDCCTRNVTMTTAEGTNLVRNLNDQQRGDVLDRLKSAAHTARFQPAITVNEMADRCAAGEALPEEQLDPAAGSCPLLQDDQCMVYPFRPFECRAFVSRSVCRESGQADMPTETVNVNNLIRQYIEHIDGDGSSGNLTDVLLMLLDSGGENLINNRPVSVLMVDPGHQELLDGIMEKLNTIRV